MGVCSSLGEGQPDVNGIALGFRPGNGLPPMSINCGAPAFKVSAEYLMGEVRPRLIELVRRRGDDPSVGWIPERGCLERCSIQLQAASDASRVIERRVSPDARRLYFGK